MKKKIAAILSVFMIGALVTGCGSKEDNQTPDTAQGKAVSIFQEESKNNESTSNIVTKIKEAVQDQMQPTGPIDDALATEKFSLNLDDVEEYTIENGMRNSGLETIAVVKAKDGKVDAIKASFEQVKEKKKADAWYPGEDEAADAAEIVVEGNYVGFFLIPAPEEQ